MESLEAVVKAMDAAMEDIGKAKAGKEKEHLMRKMHEMRADFKAFEATATGEQDMEMHDKRNADNPFFQEAKKAEMERRETAAKSAEHGGLPPVGVGDIAE